MRKPVELLTLAVCIWIAWIFRDLIASPFGLLLNGRADGLKNLVVFAYPASSPFWSHVMNYPWGEHRVFLDGQPLLAWLTSWMSPDARIAFLQLLLIAEIPLAAWLYGVVLHRMELRGWIPAMIAFALALTTPQWARLGGHFALAHAAAIPSVLLARLVFGRVVAGGAVFAWGWIHPYWVPMLGAVAAAFDLALTLGEPLPGLRARGWAIARAAALGALPLVAFGLALRLSDPVTDRAVASQAMNFASNWRGVFLLPWVEFAQTIGSPALNWIALPDIEGRAAVSLLGLPLLVAVLVRGSRRSRWLACAALALLLLSFLRALPPPLEQFRSLGRFAWGFHALFGIALAQALVDWARKSSRRHDLMGWIAVLLAVEALAFSGLRFGSIGAGLVPVQARPAWAGLIVPEDYQAILSLPYFLNGTEDGLSRVDDGSHEASLWASLWLEIPSIGHNGSRVSVSRARIAASFFRDGVASESWDRALHDRRKILVLMPKESSLTPLEREIWHAAEPLPSGSLHAHEARAIDPDRLLSLAITNSASSMSK